MKMNECVVCSCVNQYALPMLHDLHDYLPATVPLHTFMFICFLNWDL